MLVQIIWIQPIYGGTLFLRADGSDQLLKGGGGRSGGREAIQASHGLVSGVTSSFFTSETTRTSTQRPSPDQMQGSSSSYLQQ